MTYPLREETAAVVVSYDGADTLRETVGALRSQVATVHIVDNGSGPETSAVLDALERDGTATVERLGANCGIAEALNRGVAHARALGSRWLLTMDQDSRVAPDLVAAYERAIVADASRVCLSPTIDGGPRRRAPAADGEVQYAITSGNLVRLDVFDAIGTYDASLFIDCVDFDFCLRLRRAGFRVHRVADARMFHRLGEAREVPAFARRHYILHSPVRRYYMFRNYLYLAERHLLRFPGFIAKLGVGQAILFVLMGFFDPRPRASYAAAFRGMAHWMARRRGPMPQGAR
jgi:rhamnosyltransferase